MEQHVSQTERDALHMVSAQTKSTQSAHDYSHEIDIEQLLIWTYRVQRADVVLAGGRGLFDQEALMDGDGSAGGRDSLVSLERLARLGVRVDASGPPSDALHVEAELVHEAVMRLDRPIALLVIEHARAATRPDEIEIVQPKAMRILNRQGGTKVVFADWDAGHNWGHCPVEWTVGLGNAEVARLEYHLWRRALGRLTDELRKSRITALVVFSVPDAPRL